MTEPTRTHPASVLPTELESLIARVVKRARLRKAERRDVERELRSHFVEGIAEGKTAAELVGEFGDANASARLIGRAKRRCRGIVWQAFVWARRGVMALFALVVVTYAWAAWAYYGAEPTITRNYLKEMNAKIEAIPMEDRAWPEYRKAILGVSREDHKRIKELWTDGVESSNDWAEVCALLEKQSGAIELILEASKMPAMGYSASVTSDAAIHNWFGYGSPEAGLQGAELDNPPMISLRLEAADVMGELGSIVHWNARMALERGDGARWGDLMTASLRMAAHTGETPSLLGYTRAVSVQWMVLFEVANALATRRNTISDEALVNVLHSIAGNNGWLEKVPLELERAGVEDLIQRLYSPRTGRISGAGVAAIGPHFSSDVWPDSTDRLVARPSVFLGPITAMLMARRERVLDRVNWAFASWERRASQPLLSRDDDSVDVWIAHQGSGLARIRWWPLYMTFPAVDAVINWRDRVVQQSQSIEAAIAIELFRRHEGRLPASLDELVPRYLPRTPIDIYSGKSIRYAVKDGVPVVYSVGCDMDDDDGRVPPPHAGKYMWYAALGPPGNRQTETWPEEQVRAHDGDWILWPPVDEKTGEFVRPK